MKVITQLSLLGVMLVLGLAGCQPAAEVETKPTVVATSTIIADLAQEIGGEEIKLESLLKPGDDPHVYEPVPQDTRSLERAALILYNGYNLEPALIRLINGSGLKAKKIAVGEQVPPLEINYQGSKVPDPHVWGSAENGIIMVAVIRDALIELAPEHEQEFRENAAQLTADLTELHQWIKAEIATIPSEQRYLITTHDAFGYYSQAYDIPIAGTLIGISTEEQPSAQTVKNLVEEIKKIGVRAIFAETTINPNLITTVAEEAGVKLAPRQLYADSIGAPGSEADSYLKMLEANTRTIVEALRGNEGQESGG